MKSWDIVWEKVFQSQEWGKYPGESLIRFVARNFYAKDRKTIRILEIGCGTGANIWFLAREGFHAYGIDGSTTAIKKAERRMKEEGLKADLKVGDIIKLPYKDNYFDLVVDVECLYCNSRENTRKILMEIKRVLKKEGYFYSRTLTDSMYIGKKREKVGYLEYKNVSDGPTAGKGFVRLMDKAEILKLYGKVFEIVSIDKSEYTVNNGL